MRYLYKELKKYFSDEYDKFEKLDALLPWGQSSKNFKLIEMNSEIFRTVIIKYINGRSI
jgi:hypothetical protein